MTTPFVFKFKRGENSYLYDVHSNNIIRVNAMMYDLIDYVGDSPFQNYTIDEIDNVRKEIEKENDSRGLFRGNSIEKMVFPFSKSEYTQALKNITNHIILNVTDDCNNQCEYCKFSGHYPYSRTHRKKDMPLSVALKAVDFLFSNSEYFIKASNDRFGIGFYGGEPLLKYELINRTVSYVKEKYFHLIKRVHFAMTSNLIVMNHKIIDFLIENQFSLLVSLDGPEIIHDRYRKTKTGEGTFSLVLKNLEEIKKRSPEYFEKNIGFSIVLAPPYDLQSVKEFFIQKDFLKNRVAMISYVDSDDTSFFDQFGEMEKINDDLVEQLTQLKDEYKKYLITEQRNSSAYQFSASLFEDKIKDVYLRNIFPLKNKIFPNGICLPGIQKVLIDPDGKFHICEKIGDSFSIGDVWNGFDVDTIFKIIYNYIQISDDVCRDCWAVRFCKACFIRATMGNKFDQKRKLEHCMQIKGALLSGMKFYSEIMEKSPKALEFIKNIKSTGVTDLVFKFIQNLRDQHSGSDVSSLQQGGV